MTCARFTVGKPSRKSSMLSTGFNIVEKRLHWHTSTGKACGAAHHFRINADDVLLHAHSLAWAATVSKHGLRHRRRLGRTAAAEIRIAESTQFLMQLPKAGPSRTPSSAPRPHRRTPPSREKRKPVAPNHQTNKTGTFFLRFHNPLCSAS